MESLWDFLCHVCEKDTKGDRDSDMIFAVKWSNLAEDMIGH